MSFCEGKKKLNEHLRLNIPYLHLKPSYNNCFILNLPIFTSFFNCATHRHICSAFNFIYYVYKHYYNAG